MSYDLHLSRTRDWLRAGDDPLDASVWAASAAAHPQLSPSRGGSGHDFDLVGRDITLFLEDGQVTVRGWGDDNPGVLATLRDLADALGLHLTGDEWESYERDGTVVPYEPTDELEEESLLSGPSHREQGPRPPLLRRLGRRLNRGPQA